MANDKTISTVGMRTATMDMSITPPVSAASSNNYLKTINANFGITWVLHVINTAGDLIQWGIYTADDGLTVANISKLLGNFDLIQRALKDIDHINDIKNELLELGLNEKYKVGKAVLEVAQNIVKTVSASAISYKNTWNDSGVTGIDSIVSVINLVGDIARKIVQENMFSAKIDMSFVLKNLPWIISLFGEIKDIVKMSENIRLEIEDLSVSEGISLANIAIDTIYSVLTSTPEF